MIWVDDMIMPPSHAFEVADAHPLGSALRPQLPVRRRIGPALITLAVHLLVIVALAGAFPHPQRPQAPAIVMVHIAADTKAPDAPPPLPHVIMPFKPADVTAPPPQVSIAPSPMAVAASPPAPPPPAASLAPPRVAPAMTTPSWQALVLARLQQAKRYPPLALVHRWQGVAMLHFTMDRQGAVLSANIEKGSGHDALDQEALALLQRAQPLPRPPPGISGELLVPIEFSLDNRSGN